MLTNYTIGDNLYISRLRESNSRPPAYKAGAITTMLHRQLTVGLFFYHSHIHTNLERAKNKRVVSTGLEPATLGLLDQCSTN